MNYLQELPFDLQEVIGFKVHKLYMYDLAEELEEFVEDWNWRKENNLGDDFADWDTDMTSDTEDTNSLYSFTESEN
jgi:hypothetical protein